MAVEELDRVRQACVALPEVVERLSHFVAPKGLISRLDAGAT